MERERQAAEAKGREVYEQAIRTGQKVKARTRAELIALGRSKLAREAGQVGLQGDTALRGATDIISFGAVNRIAAAMDTASGYGGPGDLRQRFDRNLNQERVRDDYDSVHRPLARRAGEAAGMVVSAARGFAGGRALSNSLGNAAKRELGETLSLWKSRALGDRPMYRPNEPHVLDRTPKMLSNGRRTVPDHYRQSGKIVEAKFGFSAGLTRNQRVAQRELRGNYQVDHWTPDHIGYATGALQGGAAAGAGIAASHSRKRAP